MTCNLALAWNPLPHPKQGDATPKTDHVNIGLALGKLIFRILKEGLGELLGRYTITGQGLSPAFIQLQGPTSPLVRRTVMPT